MSDKHNPTPWRVRPHLPDSHFEVIADANDNTVGTATLPENAEYIVKAANEFETINELYHFSFVKAHKAICKCDRLSAFVRELCECLKEADAEAYTLLIERALEAVNEMLYPPPWKLDGDVIRDASGGVVISSINPCNTAVRKMIVESVNAMAALKEAGDKLGRYYTPEAILANPPWKSGEIEVFTLKSFEQVRDLLRRVANCLERYHLTGDRETALLREVRETLGKEDK